MRPRGRVRAGEEARGGRGGLEGTVVPSAALVEAARVLPFFRSSSEPRLGGGKSGLTPRAGSPRLPLGGGGAAALR